MATLSKASPAISGTTFSPTAAGGSGDKFDNRSMSALFYVKNASGGSINVTFTAQDTSRAAGNGFPAMTLSDEVVAVGAGAEKIIGPFPGAFNDDDYMVNVSYSATTSVTVAVIQP